MSQFNNSFPSKSSPTLADRVFANDAAINKNRGIVLQAIFDLFKGNFDDFYAGVDSVFTSEQASQLYALKDNVYTKLEVDGLRNASFVGQATPTTVPDINLGSQFYIAADNGTFTNFGGAVVDLTQGLTMLSYDGNAWEKIVIPIEMGGYATLQDIEGYDRINLIVEDPKNLVKRSDIIPGYYQTSGNLITSSNNWICTKKIEIDPETQYVVNPIDLQGNILFFNASGALISYLIPNSVEFPFVTPAGTVKAAFTVDNRVDIALNPLDPNGNGNTFQVEEGTVATTYEEPFIGVNADRVKGINTETLAKISTEKADVEGKLNFEKARIDFLFTDYDSYLKFDGTADGNPGSFTLANTGDYIEFNSRIGAGFVDFYDGLGLAGNPSSVGINKIGYYSTTSIFIRENVTGNPYLQFTGLPNLTEFHIIKLEAGSGVWNLYIDGELVGTKTKTNGINITSIGNAYNGGDKIIADIKSIDIYTSTASLKSIRELADFVSYNNIEKVFVKNETEEETTSFSNCYVSYDPTGYSGNELITVFAKREGKSTYTGYQIIHQYNMDDTAYTDYWRIQRADEYSFSNGSMTKIEDYTLFNGESEFTMLCDGKSDHTGGTHGDEIIQSVTFFMDGVPITLSTSLNITPCNEFSYVAKSTLHETAATAGTFVAGHPIIADHSKHTTFFNGGYKTYNKVDFRAITNVTRAYIGICCLGKMQAQKGYNENYEIKTFIGNGAASLVRGFGMKEFFAFNDTKGYSGHVSSNLILPSNIPAENIEMWITDRPDDSKYYRATPSFTAQVGDVWAMEMIVKLQ